MPRTLMLAALLAGAAHAEPLTVFAAASLTDAFTELGRAFDARTGHRTTFQFAGSQTLRAQLEGGARADVIASANAAQYDPLVRAGLVEPARTFARNRLILIAPRRSARVQTLADLARPGVRLVLADRSVPVGDYARRMLSAIDASGTYGRDFSARVLRNVVSEEPNVRQVALKVQLGEADAAVVYATDLTPALKGSVRAVALPSRFNQTATYPLGAVRNAGAPNAARQFVQYVLSPDGQRILRKWGFLSPQ
ncbi:molybdate ABC transporter substrate-binding protein [Deinococcus maricopensis]|uniref:Molybdenum ABC transporter, periplasmic molybdate-binding protein n=1 Tax=Deinococcus maricopensis (strain DSM 21211 / LMG 22137 / NRRL B-23946 / LB-34) TaxID=709986 RepID=E8U5N6_DEIML|nr:molybdate ABC transporter substrate-binding protein [Deinococcus maricopensis]ADV66375.1 molybdenum ABC transporter, periplasmic molybdate-binding protein [Deinococcus maricopensis DSM 21211]